MQEVSGSIPLRTQPFHGWYRSSNLLGDAKFEKLALTGGLFWCLGEKKPDESGGFPSAPKFETFKSHADGADKGAGRINESGVCRFRP